MFKQIARITVSSLALVAAMSSHAGTVTVFDTVAAGTAQFDSIVTAAGGTVKSDVWTSLPSSDSITYIRPGYRVSSTDGDARGTRTSPGMSGQGIEIDNEGRYIPALPAGDYYLGGLTFKFDNPINAFGFEIGQWGTCCWPSTLFVSFDGGAPIVVGTSNSLNDTPDAIFVAALDDTGTFSTVQFWGSAFIGGDLNDYVIVGGTIRYALIDSTTPGVPEPGTLALVGVGLASLAAARRRRKA